MLGTGEIIDRGRFRLRFAGLAQRDAEVAALEQALEHAQNRAPSVTVIIGAAGIGKSRLVRHAVDRARARNAIPLRGECVRVAGGELPYAPLAAALRDAPQDVMEAALAQLPSEARADLALVLPRLAPPGAAAADQSQASRFQLARLFD